MNRDDPFLSNEENFRFIKTIAEVGDLHTFQGSIYDEKMIENIVDVAKAEGIQFSSLFISNVYDWDNDTEKQNLFLKNMERLSNDKTLIVDVVPSSGNHWTVNVAHYIDPQSKQPYNPQAVRKTRL